MFDDFVDVVAKAGSSFKSDEEMNAACWRIGGIFVVGMAVLFGLMAIIV